MLDSHRAEESAILERFVLRGAVGLGGMALALPGRQGGIGDKAFEPRNREPPAQTTVHRLLSNPEPNKPAASRLESSGTAVQVRAVPVMLKLP